MKKAVSLLPLAILTTLTATALLSTACSGSPNGRSAPREMRPEPTGSFQAQGPTPENRKPQNRKPCTEPAFDARVRAGHRFALTQEAVYPGSDFNATAVSLVKSAEPARQVSQVQVTLQFGTGERHNLQYDSGIRIVKDAEGRAKFEFEPNDFDERIRKIAPALAYCTVFGEGPQEEIPAEVEGTYRMPNGLALRAYKQTRVTKGTVRCYTVSRDHETKETLHGEGREESVRITSPDAPRVSGGSCDEALIFSFARVTDSKGAFIGGSRVEFTDVPLL